MRARPLRPNPPRTTAVADFQAVARRPRLHSKSQATPVASAGAEGERAVPTLSELSGMSATPAGWFLAIAARQGLGSIFFLVRNLVVSASATTLKGNLPSV